jgi:hypothetical protein
MILNPRIAGARFCLVTVTSLGAYMVPHGHTTVRKWDFFSLPLLSVVARLCVSEFKVADLILFISAAEYLNILTPERHQTAFTERVRLSTSPDKKANNHRSRASRWQHLLLQLARNRSSKRCVIRGGNKGHVRTSLRATVCFDCMRCWAVRFPCYGVFTSFLQRNRNNDTGRSEMMKPFKYVLLSGPGRNNGNSLAVRLAWFFLLQIR